MASLSKTILRRGRDRKKMVKKKKIVKSEREKIDIGAEYERKRALTIQENMKKLEELGIRIATPNMTMNKKTPKRKPKADPPPSMPRRSSSRLMNKGFVNEDEWKGIEENQNYAEEIYTSEHEMLLGDHKTPWVPDNNRQYDSVNGTTCHQCRQKTLGPRTECNTCLLPRGRLCGNCLYTRYGENILEAKEKTSWSCPACRDICNCSRCRQQKGWPPTGTIHKKAWEMGFKSVAHYLIYTHRGRDQ